MLTPLAWLVPHVPTLLVDSIRGHRTPMLAALEDLSHLLFEDRPGAVVVVSARWQTSGPFMVDAGKRHRTLTDYSGFGVEVRYDCNGHPALAKALIAAGLKAGVRTTASTRGVDSGVAVPMSFLIPDKSVPVVPVSVADRPIDECRAWGAAMARAIDNWAEPVLFVRYVDWLVELLRPRGIPPDHVRGSLEAMAAVLAARLTPDEYAAASAGLHAALATLPHREPT